jgi:hypothetical protein
MTFIMQRYDGPARPRSEVASIRTDERGPTLASVDGEPIRLGAALEPGNRLHVEVLPGVHQVEVDVADPATGLVHPIAGRFIAAPGKVYRVAVRAATDMAPGDSRYELDAYEVDRDSDARLGAAAQPPPPAP